jgi:hypothetical protein
MLSLVLNALSCELWCQLCFESSSIPSFVDCQLGCFNVLPFNQFLLHPLPLMHMSFG